MYFWQLCGAAFMSKVLLSSKEFCFPFVASCAVAILITTHRCVCDPDDNLMFWMILAVVLDTHQMVNHVP